MHTIMNELAKHNITLHDTTYDIISNKDSIIVARIKTPKESMILKYFETDKHRRELTNYRLLNVLDIQTFQVLSSTDTSILLEDVSKNKHYRLATQPDLKCENVIVTLAKWYNKLHTQGKCYFMQNPNINLYSELEELTYKNIDFVKKKSNYSNGKYWNTLIQYMPYFIKYHKQNRTFTYNDFYYTNLALKKDRTESFMFDYNLLGEGLVYSDLRNVTSSLDDTMSEKFLSAYGTFDSKEKLIDDAISPIFTLLFAYKREYFPNWANSELNKLLSHELEYLLYQAINNIPLIV